jgi:hypothetical protein
MQMNIVQPGCELRPEMIESAFYLYYFTEDPRYLQMGQTPFDSLVNYTRNEVACAASAMQRRRLSVTIWIFFFTETLKCLYVLLGPPQ